MSVTRWAQNVTIRPLSHETTRVGVSGWAEREANNVTTKLSAAQRPTGHHHQRGEITE